MTLRNMTTRARLPMLAVTPEEYVMLQGVFADARSRRQYETQRIAGDLLARCTPTQDPISHPQD